MDIKNIRNTKTDTAVYYNNEKSNNPFNTEQLGHTLDCQCDKCKYLRMVERTLNTPLTDLSKAENSNELYYNTRITVYKNSVEIKQYDKGIRKKRNKTKKQLEQDEQRKKEVKKIYKGGIAIDPIRSANNSAKRTIQSIYSIARSNIWEYFITFTIDPKKVNSADYEAFTKCVSDWLSNVKKRFAPDLKYLLVPELHLDKKKWHLHGLFADIGNLTLVDSGLKTDKDEIIYNLLQYKFGWSYITEVKDNKRVSSYITKYITKDLCFHAKSKRKYWSSRNLEKPEIMLENFAPDDIKTLCESFGEIGHIKSVDVDSAYNRLDVYQINID